MTILTTYDTYDPNEWYIRRHNTVCSPMLQVQGEDNTFEFGCWTVDYHLLCALSNYPCVIGQAVNFGGGFVPGDSEKFWYPNYVILKVEGAEAWNKITALFDDWILGPVWGKAMIEVVIAAESEGWR